MAALGLLAAAACSRAVQPTQAALPAPPGALTLSPGDEIEVKFRYTSELNEMQRIRPDGKISLQLIDEVAAAGLTPEELRAKLFALYEPQLINPALTVIVRSLSGERVYVGGEVTRPGVLTLGRKLTVLQAIMEAGGLTATAKPSNVLVIRQSQGKQHAMLVDVGTSLETGESQPFDLAAEDIVYVPKTKIAKLDQWVDGINGAVPDIVRDIVVNTLLIRSLEASITANQTAGAATK